MYVVFGVWGIGILVLKRLPSRAFGGLLGCFVLVGFGVSGSGVSGSGSATLRV